MKFKKENKKIPKKVGQKLNFIFVKIQKTNHVAVFVSHHLDVYA